MMEITPLVPDKDILSELGRRLKKLRKQRQLNQDELATAAGIGVATLRRIEDGQDSQIGSWIKLLKALQRLDGIDGLLPENFKSPMAEAADLGKAIRPKKTPAGAPLWGDEKP
jgi:transcriptional regulator with XRE-family HTH domain